MSLRDLIIQPVHTIASDAALIEWNSDLKTWTTKVTLVDIAKILESACVPWVNLGNPY